MKVSFELNSGRAFPRSKAIYPSAHLDGSPSKSDDDKVNDEFHDAQELLSDSDLVEKFEDALSLDTEEHLSEEELQANKEKSDALKQEGNQVFKSGEYAQSIVLYSKALDICPKQSSNERSILFGNRAAAHIQIDNKESAIEDCTKALQLNDKYIKVLFRYETHNSVWFLWGNSNWNVHFSRAKLYEDTDKLDESQADYNRILELDSANGEARGAIARLAPKIEERNEKLKTEMIGKLKDLGNMILKPFGLSTNNFQMQQDPGTGSYSMNFKQWSFDVTGRLCTYGPFLIKSQKNISNYWIKESTKGRK